MKQAYVIQERWPLCLAFTCVADCVLVNFCVERNVSNWRQVLCGRWQSSQKTLLDMSAWDQRVQLDLWWAELYKVPAGAVTLLLQCKLVTLLERYAVAAAAVVEL